MGEPGFLDLLEPADREALSGCGRRQKYEASTRLMQEGDPGDAVALLIAGRVKISTSTREGHERVLDFRGAGELLGELSVLDGGPRLSSVTAIEPVETLLLPASEFRRLLQSRPAVSEALLRTLTSRFRDADLKRVEFGASDTVGRVAARLVELAERFGEPAEGGVAIGLPITQEELAGWTGASRAGVASALRTLRDLGWIDTGRRKLTVRDMKALKTRSA
jgi:CRP/FNR family transcriptional regulator, cyclic AMP receptor protein